MSGFYIAVWIADGAIWLLLDAAVLAPGSAGTIACMPGDAQSQIVADLIRADATLVIVAELPMLDPGTGRPASARLRCAGACAMLTIVDDGKLPSAASEPVIVAV